MRLRTMYETSIIANTLRVRSGGIASLLSQYLCSGIIPAACSQILRSQDM